MVKLYFEADRAWKKTSYRKRKRDRLNENEKKSNCSVKVASIFCQRQPFLVLMMSVKFIVLMVSVKIVSSVTQIFHECV